MHTSIPNSATVKHLSARSFYSRLLAKVPRKLHQERNLSCQSNHEASVAASTSTSGSDPSSSDVVQISYRGHSITARKGALLRTAMLRGDLSPHNGQANLINCRGLGTCGTCAVQISGSVTPLEWTTKERLRLHFPPHSAPNNANLRLACQVRCQGDLHVVKYDGFWGQGSILMGNLAGSTSSNAGAVGAAGGLASSRRPPFGELEYVLDPDSWQR